MQPGQNLYFEYEIPIDVSNIISVSIKYKKRNFLKRNSIRIDKVQLMSEKTYETKYFCPNINVLEIYNEQWYPLTYSC